MFVDWGEPMGILKSMVDRGEALDGFKGLLLFRKRFDMQTAATLLQAYMDVVKPQGTSNILEAPKVIHNWEPRETIIPGILV